MKTYQLDGLGKISAHNVGDSYMKSGIPSRVKSSISKSINILIETRKPKKIKIGKTGNIDKRRVGSDYESFNRMELLYQTKSKKHVAIIESYYIEYITKHYPSLSINMKGGSAGRDTESKWYHVYLVLD